MELFPDQKDVFQEVKSGLPETQLSFSQQKIEDDAEKLTSTKADIFNKAQLQDITQEEALEQLQEANKIETIQDL